MKALFAALCCCALFTQSATAQNTMQNKSDQTQTEWKEHTGKSAANQTYIGCSKIVGSYIYGSDNEAVGDFNSITLDLDGNVMCAIVGVGGVAGVGETEIAVPWEVFNCECKTEDGKMTCRATLPMTAEQLAKAPALEQEDYSELYDQSWVDTNSKFFGIKATSKAPIKGSMMCVTDIDGLELSGHKSMDTASNRSSEKTHTSSKPDAKSGTESDDMEEMADLGTIEEVVIDMKDKKVCYLVVGDNTGILSEKHVAIPFKQVKFSKEDGELCAKIAATAKDIETAPKVTPGEYQELNDVTARRKIDMGFTKR